MNQLKQYIESQEKTEYKSEQQLAFINGLKTAYRIMQNKLNCDNCPVIEDAKKVLDERNDLKRRIEEMIKEV